MVIATVTIEGKRHFYKRVGECNRCGYCCRMDVMNPKLFAQHIKENPLYDPRCEWLGRLEPGVTICNLYHVERRLRDGSPTGDFYDARKLFCKRWPESPEDPRYIRLANFCSFRFLECDRDGNIIPGQEEALRPGLDVVMQDGQDLEDRPAMVAPQTYPRKIDKLPDESQDSAGPDQDLTPDSG